MATQIQIKNLQEGYQSVISNGRHSIIGDEPVSVKGTDLGLSPTELVLSGLAFCKVATIRNVARRNQWEIGEVSGVLAMDVKRENGKLYPYVKVDIKIEGELTEEQRILLHQEADRCYVHRLLDADWEIEPSRKEVSVSI